MNEGTRGQFKVGNLKIGSVNIYRTVLTLTNAQIKALRATPVTIVGAPLAGLFINPIDCVCELIYGGNNAFTGAANDNIALKWKDGTTSSILSGAVQAFIQATASAYSKFVPAVAAGATINVAKANVDGQALVLHNITASEIAGNAAADNLLRFTLSYEIAPSI